MNDRFIVWYEAVDFPLLQEPKVTKHLSISTDALAHALFTTGRAPGDTAQHGLTSVYEWLHRICLIPAYLRRQPNGWMARTDLARELDRSEKSAISYALGQALTGIFSTQVLGVRFLMHLDRYGGWRNVVVDPRTKSRPDLFGQRDSGGWVVAEAKGRSTPITYDVKRKMRQQKRTVRSIDGAAPEIAYGCCAYFEEVNGVERLRLYAVDPEEDEPEAIDLRVGNPDAFIASYYAPFLSALEAGETGRRPGSGDYVTASFGPYGVEVSLLGSIAERVRTALRGRLRGLHEGVIGMLQPFRNWETTPGRFADGTGVVTEWSSALGQDDWGGIDERWQ
ncbi:hypothetical protein [Streptomyces rochei]|uniref:hypothetical protein n=1 Tax=Streptomyces rochei TaxID=1928 RepID=UPI00339DFA8A